MLGNRLLRPILLLGSVLSLLFALLRRATGRISGSLQCPALGGHFRRTFLYGHCSGHLRMAFALWP